MIVVSDTSPITTLLQIQRTDILSRLFGKVIIPHAVEVELLRFHSRIPEFLEVRIYTEGNRGTEIRKA